jgi:hypothetical protein
MTLESLSARHPALAPIANAVLRAAIAAAQSEREEMTVLLEHALRMESLQLEAGQGGLPLVTAHVIAGDLWLQVHGVDEARQAYERAEQRTGQSPRVAIGLARVAARMKDVDAACRRYRQLITVWQAALARTPELEEARTYIAQQSCAGAPGR